MDTIFLSYTYNPHPDFKDETKELVRNIQIIAESQDLQVITGVDLGGSALTPEIEKRIESCDALVALITPWKDDFGNPTSPPFVNDEYTFAQGKEKPAIRFIHTTLKSQGMYTNKEYIPYDPKQAVEALLKLMRTLVLWKKTLGRTHEIQLLPEKLVNNLINSGENNSCEYQLLINRKPSAWKSTEIWPAPGGLVTAIPNVPEGAELNLKVTFGSDAEEKWLSTFCNLQNTRIKLEPIS